jgi:hypothetical protein
MLPRTVAVTLAVVFTAWSAAPAVARLECRGERVQVVADASCSHCTRIAKAASARSRIQGQCCFFLDAEAKSPVLAEQSVRFLPELQAVVGFAFTRRVVAVRPADARQQWATAAPPLQRNRPLLN